MPKNMHTSRDASGVHSDWTTRPIGLTKQECIAEAAQALAACYRRMDERAQRKPPTRGVEGFREADQLAGRSA